MTNLEIGLIATALGLVPVAVMIWLAVTAPEGWEDQHGWHPGREPDEHAHDDNLGI